MPRYTESEWLTDFIIDALDSGRFWGVGWLDKDKRIFTVPGRNRRERMPEGFDDFYEAFLEERRRHGLPEIPETETGLGCFGRLLRTANRARQERPFTIYKGKMKLNRWIMIPRPYKGCEGCLVYLTQEPAMKNMLKALFGIYPHDDKHREKALRRSLRKKAQREAARKQAAAVATPTTSSAAEVSSRSQSEDTESSDSENELWVGAQGFVGRDMHSLFFEEPEPSGFGSSGQSSSLLAPDSPRPSTSQVQGPLHVHTPTDLCLPTGGLPSPVIFPHETQGLLAPPAGQSQTPLSPEGPVPSHVSGLDDCLPMVDHIEGCLLDLLSDVGQELPDLGDLGELLCETASPQGPMQSEGGEEGSTESVSVFPATHPLESSAPGASVMGSGQELPDLGDLSELLCETASPQGPMQSEGGEEGSTESVSVLPATHPLESSAPGASVMGSSFQASDNVDDFIDCIPPLCRDDRDVEDQEKADQTFYWYGSDMRPKVSTATQSVAAYLSKKQAIYKVGDKLVPLVVEVYYFGEKVKTHFDLTGGIVICSQVPEASPEHICQTVPPYKCLLPRTAHCSVDANRTLEQTLDRFSMGVVAIGTNMGIFLKGLLEYPAYFVGNASRRRIGKCRPLSHRHEIQQAFDVERHNREPEGSRYASLFLGRRPSPEYDSDHYPVVLHIYLAPFYHRD
uniref:K11 n=1 Tax=Human herpesvirus 8 TaxID=37296 RepID=A0A7D3QFC6_HHV8|nr:K11 [Human gammaherpesvirus 8]QKE51510.1 K11 [Human gammaherpesvirus 8]QKE51598.1 K11 [Human gammaherpesvirus 8]